MLQNVYFPQETYFLILSYLVQAIQLVQNSEFYYGGGILYTGVKSARQDKNSKSSAAPRVSSCFNANF